MKFGSYTIDTVTFGYFRLDGGAMFGSVPKNLWSKIIPVDDENCIPLAARGLRIEHGGRVFLVDVGMGDKWSEKARQIFAIKNFTFSEIGFDPGQVTDVVLTHLHFDHAGGISRHAAGPGSALELVFPKATVYVQEANLENARSPSLRERASYLAENVVPLERAKLVLTNGMQEIYQGITVHRVDGHTRGQQWIEIRTEAGTVLFTTDVIPTSRHVPLPYTMGYDICTETMLVEKEAFLQKAVAEDAVVIFQHDHDTPAGRIGVNEKGQYMLREKISL